MPKFPSVLTVRSIVAVGPLGSELDSFVDHFLEGISRYMIDLPKDVKLISVSDSYSTVADV